MRKACDRSDLAKKSIGANRCGELWTENLQSEMTGMPRLLCEINCSHAAAAQDAFQLVAMLKCLLKTIQLNLLIRHSHLRCRRHMAVVRVINDGSVSQFVQAGNPVERGAFAG